MTDWEEVDPNLKWGFAGGSASQGVGEVWAVPRSVPFPVYR